MKIRALALVAMLLTGCSNEPAPSAPVEAPKAEETKAEGPAPDRQFDIAELSAAADQVALVPSPAEMERSLERAGVEAKLAQMVADRKISMDVDNKDQLAVRAGVVLADLVLTVKESPKEKVLERLDSLAVALNKLGAGNDVQATITDLKARIDNDAVSRDALVKEFDELSQVMVPELEYEAGEWVVPLIQAGSWLEGANLVSGAVKDKQKFEAADNLLRQPAVVDYFILYVNREGANKAPDEVVDKLRETLATLKTVASLPSLGQAEVETIHQSTSAVLGLL